jgi:hypothetical protein
MYQLARRNDPYRPNHTILYTRGCDVLEKYEDVVGRTRDQRRVCGARGGATVHLYSMQAFALAIVVNYTASRSCTMAKSEADCGFRCCVR